MAYLTAVLARDGGTWHAVDVDVAEAESLPELAARMRGAHDDDEPVVLLLEREDDWFALVRVDGDEDPRVFVSDPDGALSSPYADALGLDPDIHYDGASGDLDVFDDLGTDPKTLEGLTGDEGPLPSDALLAIAESAGFADVLDGMR